MKKILMLIISIMIFTGCSKLNNNDIDIDALSKYDSYLNTLVEQERYTTSSYYYDIDAVLTDLHDGTLRYDVFIENPKIAMYDIEILVVESTARRNDEIIYPNAGIFNNESYTMIPYQFNSEKGYVKAFQLSGITENKDVVLNVLITWKDYTKLSTYREFIKLFPELPVVNEVEENTDNENTDNKATDDEK